MEGTKLARNLTLQADVLCQLRRGVSPEQIAGRLKGTKSPVRISHETIYRFIYAEIARTKDYDWRHYLPRAKSKRGIRPPRGGSPASFIKDRRAIATREPEALDRSNVGHWEADLLSFAPYQHLLTLHERSSRLLIAGRTPDKNADRIAKLLLQWLSILPGELRKTLAFDNGTEFARHFLINEIGTKTYFCDPHAPWQKGGIENAHGRLRRFLPRRLNLNELPRNHIPNVLAAYNATPRKCLDFRTPAEVFMERVLQFKCESTSPPARGRR
jgi:IS30 family transposase